MHIIRPCAVADPVGARDAPPLGPNSFIFIQFLAKILQNNSLRHPVQKLTIPVGNPGSPLLSVSSRRYFVNLVHFCRSEEVREEGNKSAALYFERSIFSYLLHNKTTCLKSLQHVHESLLHTLLIHIHKSLLQALLKKFTSHSNMHSLKRSRVTPTCTH